jgi:mono/diheme cytochrome c family protein
MPDATRDLIARYLAAQPGASPDFAVPTPPPAAATAGDAMALYAKWCASCHGTSGRGDGPNAANLPVKPTAHASREAMSARPDDSLYDTIFGGGAIMNRSHRMPAFGATLSPAEIKSLVRHIRTLCRCEGPGWSRQ